MGKSKKTKIGIIGCGNMGSAIANGISSKYRVFIFDKDAGKTKDITKAKVVKTIPDLLGSIDVVIIAVKPQDFDTVLNEIKNCINGKLVISIAAGVSIGYIEKILGKVRVIRVMPNLPARIGKGVTYLSKGYLAPQKDLKFVLKLFSYLGEAFVIAEDMMSTVTAVSGSGPGFWGATTENMPEAARKKYTYDIFIPEFSVAAEKMGFSKKQAHILAKSVGEGSLATVESLGLSSSEFKTQVASKGGTTEAGLKDLKGNAKFLLRAFRRALKRAKELSRR